MKTKLVILDFDGTLADTMPFMLTIMDQLAEKFGLEKMDKSTLQELRGLHALTILKMHNIPARLLPKMARESQKMLYENIETIPMFPGMGQLIKDLYDSGIKIAVVTSNTLENVLKVLGGEIAQLVSTFECQVDMFGKSSKLRKVLRRTGVKPDEVLSVGDEIRDIEAARKVGIPCAAVSWGYADPRALQQYGPDYLVEDINQLMAIIGCSQTLADPVV